MTDFADKVHELMFQLVTEAKDEERDAIIAAVRDWKKRYPRSWASIRRQPIAFAFMDATLSADRYINAVTEENDEARAAAEAAFKRIERAELMDDRKEVEMLSKMYHLSDDAARALHRMIKQA